MLCPQYYFSKDDFDCHHDFAIRRYYPSRVVIFGAGAAGRQLAVGLGQSRECVLLAFVDDGIQLHGRDLMAIRPVSTIAAFRRG